MTTDIQALLKESQAEYRQLGKSGLRVSVPILGAMSIGDKRWQEWVIEEDEALPLLKAAYDKGINTWDTGTLPISTWMIPSGVHANLAFLASQRLLQRRLGNPDRQSHQEIQHPAPKDHRPHKMLRAGG